MKLRQQPEDFIVEEIILETFSSDPLAFKVFLVKKRGIETFALISYISKKFNVPRKDIGFAGLKDKHAVTYSYCTVPSTYDITLGEANLEITFKGYQSEPFSPGDLVANKFTITVRQLSKRDIEQMNTQLPFVKNGVPNYFDSQRFGSSFNGQFIGKFALLEDYEKAVKTYLTAFSKSEPKQLKDEKRALVVKWPRIELVSVKTPKLSRIIDTYKKTASWKLAYEEIPSDEKHMQLQAYFSYLWNEALKQHMWLSQNSVLKSAVVQYAVGTLFFGRKMDDSHLIGSIDIPVLGGGICSQYSDLIMYERILKREKVSFDLIDSCSISFAKRDAILVPQNLAVFVSGDENNSGYEKAVISFELQKGSYATVIVKALFLQ